MKKLFFLLISISTFFLFNFTACDESQNPVKSSIDTLYIITNDTIIQKDSIFNLDTVIINNLDTIFSKDTIIQKDSIIHIDTLVINDSTFIFDTIFSMHTIFSFDTIFVKDSSTYKFSVLEGVLTKEMHMIGTGWEFWEIPIDMNKFDTLICAPLVRNPLYNQYHMPNITIAVHRIYI